MPDPDHFDNGESDNPMGVPDMPPEDQPPVPDHNPS
jgi:hypothetical protein